MNYTVVIDGGGTKSRCDVYTSQRIITHTSIGGYANFSVNPSQSLENIICLLDNVSKSVNSNLWNKIVCGLSGIKTYLSQEEISRIIQEKFGCPCIVTTDIDLARRSYLRENGVIVVSGTGSVALGKKDTHILSVGGWGHLLGDEGSAYAIGLMYVKRMINRYNHGIELTLLDQQVLSFLNISSLVEIIPKVYSSSKEVVASVSGFIAEHTNEEVSQIMREQAILLAEQVIALINRLKFMEEVKLYLLGSLFEKNQEFKLYFTQHLDQLQLWYRVQENIEAVTLGGVLIDESSR